MITRLRPLLPVAALIIFVLLCYHKLAFTDGILARGDTYVYFYPYWSARDAALREGRIPLWTPDIFMGAPMLADIQVAALYPPNWLTSPLPAPDAIRVSVLLHVIWAAMGAYFLARTAAKLSMLPALLAAAIYALSGHLGGHAEQINQLQGLAWLPWLFLAYHRAIRPLPEGLTRVQQILRYLRRITLLGAGIALQVLCGHTQTVFITAAGLALYGLASTRIIGSTPFTQRLWRWFGQVLRAAALLALAGLVAALLDAPQLIPTSELVGLSNRRGGLPPGEVAAFSLNPLVIGRALLPNYDTHLFGEFVAYVGVIGVGLAIYGGLAAIRRKPDPDSYRSESLVGVWIVLAAVGLFLALGRYNLIYFNDFAPDAPSLALLPGFNLFRVPARWLALFTLGMALLAGIGLEALWEQTDPTQRHKDTKAQRIGLYPLFVMVGLAVTVIGGLIVGAFLTPRAPEAAHMEGLTAPTLPALIGWGVALLIFVICVGSARFASAPRRKVLAASALAAFSLIELLIAGAAQRYNDLSAPDAYYSRRFTASQLQVYQQNDNVPGRVLSISGLYFDPGDRAALEARYTAYGMSDTAIRNSFVAIKMQETLTPNLPLMWGIPSVDGHGGGVIPTAYYSAFTALLTPDGHPSFDGRLRENLARSQCRGICLPDQRWLDLMNVEYLIVDKVFDFWQDGVAYDTTFQMRAFDDDEPASFLLNAPDFEFTHVHVVFSGQLPALLIDDQRLTAAEIVEVNPEAPSLAGYQIAYYSLSTATTIQADFSLTLTGDTDVRAVTLVDQRVSETFMEINPIGWQRILSSDIKLYRRTDPAPRAYWIDAAPLSPDQIYAASTAVDGQIDIRSYQAERIEISVNNPEVNERYLMLADAWYPGWTATIDGIEVPIYRANIMFRAVQVPPGEHNVIFTFRPTHWNAALWIGGVTWVLAALVIVLGTFLAQPRRPSSTSVSDPARG